MVEFTVHEAREREGSQRLFLISGDSRDRRWRRWLAGVTLAGALLGGAMLGGSSSAFADAAGPASCMGHEASNLSPPGSSDEGAMRDFAAFFRESFPGTPAGAFIGTIARLHEGSHEACDEAIEG